MFQFSSEANCIHSFIQQTFIMYMKYLDLGHTKMQRFWKEYIIIYM